MNKRHSKYTEEFRQQAVRLIREQGYSLGKASKNLGVPTSTLDNWLARHQETTASELSESDQRKLLRLEQENRELRMECDLLKEAAVYFAGESKPGTRS